MSLCDEKDKLLEEFDPDEFERELAGDRMLGDVDEVQTQKHVALSSSAFTDFLLKPELIRAIADSGYEHPSQVQHECLPQALMGNDLICQAQSGMGKTAVYVMSILQQIDPDLDAVQAIVVCPTRELAYQACGEFIRFSKYFASVNTVVCYGGIPMSVNRSLLRNRKPKIVVGTPGRLRHLITTGDLDVSSVRHFVMDEVDELLKSIGMRTDVIKIFCSMPRDKQVMMFSATFGSSGKMLCRKFMPPNKKNVIEILVTNEEKLTLFGIRQYYTEVSSDSEKNRKLSEVLAKVDFNQVFVFVRSRARAESLAAVLNRSGFPSLCMHSKVPQEERVRRFNLFKTFQARIVVSTDLMGRGVDIQRANVVINYDLPPTPELYLHRVGRCGRFGGKGLALSFVVMPDDEDEDGDDVHAHSSREGVGIGMMSDSEFLAEVQKRFTGGSGGIRPLPEVIEPHEYQ